MGTQMKKVAIGTLTPGRTYVVEGSGELTANEVRDQIMECLNELSSLGKL